MGQVEGEVIKGYGTTVLALDPGKSTGYALCSVYKGEPHTNGVTHPILGDRWVQVHSSGSLSFEEAPRALPVLLDEAVTGHWRRSHVSGQTHNDASGKSHPVRPAVLLCEHFTLTVNAVRGQSGWSLEVIGMARMLAARAEDPVQFDTTQQPSAMKNLIHNNRVLHECGLIREKMTQHEKDALGHALLFATRLGR